MGEHRGFITEYVAILHQLSSALAMHWRVLPEVMEAYLLTEEYGYLIKVAVSGTEDYERFLRQKLYKRPGIRHS